MKTNGKNHPDALFPDVRREEDVFNLAESCKLALRYYTAAARIVSRRKSSQRPAPADSRKQLQSTVNLRQEALETPGSKLEYAGTTSLEHPQALRKCGPTGFYCTDYPRLNRREMQPDTQKIT